MESRRRQGATGCLVAFVVLALGLFLAAVWLGVRVDFRDGALVVELSSDQALNAERERVVTRRRRKPAPKEEPREGSADDNLFDARGGLAEIDELGFIGERLGAQDQDLYLQLYRAAAEGYDELVLTGVSSDGEVQRVWLCMLDDHPELFWLDGGFSYSLDERRGEMIVRFGLNDSASEAERYEGLVEEAAEAFLRSLPSDASDYDVALKAYEHIIARTSYVKGAPNDQNILSVFDGGESVCAGYARSFQYLLLRAGLPCGLVRGTGRSGEREPQSHVWNLISIDDACAYVDPSWGDHNPQTTDGENPDWGEIRYPYFGMTYDEAVETGHIFEDPDRWPPCETHALNVYQRRGMLFESYEREAFQDHVLDAIDLGDVEMECQFVDTESYDACRSDLKEGGCLQALPSWLGSNRASWRLISNDTTRTMRLTWTVE